MESGKVKSKKSTSGSRMDILELARHLRQEHLFVTSERQNMQMLNEKVMRTVEKLYHLSWIAKQQRINLENFILGRPDSYAAACCQRANLLEETGFIDSYKQLGANDTLYAEFLQQLREDTKLVAVCLAVGEKLSTDMMHTMVQVTMSSIYGNCIIPEDEVLVLSVLKELMVLQLATSDNPRRLLRHGSCAFSQVYKMFSEGLFSAKLFLTAALHGPIMQLLMEDDLFLDIDPGKAVIRFPPQERLRHFGQEGTPEYIANLQRYRMDTINRLVTITNRFIEGIRSNMYCFPQSLSWLVRQMYNVVMKAKRVEVREVGAMCADLVFVFFICPAVVNPEPYGITDAPISYIARFNLMQVAQILQVLAMSKWEDIDPKLMDLYGKFEKDCMSSLLDLILEGTSDDSPSDVVCQLRELSRSAVLITENDLMQLVSFLQSVHKEIKDENVKKTLGNMLSTLPSPPQTAVSSSTTLPLPSSQLCPNNPMLTIDTPPSTPSMKRTILGKVSRKAARPASGSDNTDTSEDQGAEDTSTVVTSLPDVLVIPIGAVEYDCPGMLSEEKVLSMEQQKRQSRVRMNLESLNNEEADSVASGSETVEKRTRFSLSQDQESVGTSDNLEAISEAASNHSVASSLDLENENENENDNLSDMVSANVSARGTPNVSGRETPSSQIEGEEQEEQQPLNFSITSAKQNQEDIEEKFGRFEIKPLMEGDETKSMVSDTWSTDVLASDSETVEQTELPSVVQAVALDSQPAGAADETASQSDAWSTDVIMSDTERLQELDTDDTASVAPSDDTTRSEVESEAVGSDVAARGAEAPIDDIFPGSAESRRLSLGHVFTYSSDLHLSASPGQHQSQNQMAPPLYSPASASVAPNMSIPSSQPFCSTPSSAPAAIPSSSTSLFQSSKPAEEPAAPVAMDTLKMFDPLSVDVELEGSNVSSSVTPQDDLTPTGVGSYSPPEACNSLCVDDPAVEISGSPQEHLASMQSLGRLSLNMRGLPSNEHEAFLNSLQETAESAGGQHSRKSSIADLLAIDLSKTLNLNASGAETLGMKKTSSGSSLLDFEREVLGMEQSPSPVFPRAAGDAPPVDDAEQVQKRNTAAATEAKLDLLTVKNGLPSSVASLRNSATSVSSSGSSSGTSVDLNLRPNSVPLDVEICGLPTPPPDTSQESIAVAEQSPTIVLPAGASSGGVPKSISFNESVDQVSSELLDGDDRGDRMKGKGFFKLSNFRFTFRGKGKKSPHSNERFDFRHRVVGEKGDRSSDAFQDRPHFKPVIRTFSEGARASHAETSDEILAKYRKKPSMGSAAAGELSGSSALNPHVSSGPPGSNNLDPVNGEEVQVFDLSNLDSSSNFIDAKRKLRMVLGSADVQTLPWLGSYLCRPFPMASGANMACRSRDNELVAFLKVLLAEAINLQQRPLVAHLHEALRCVQMFNDSGCQKLFWSLREDYQQRAPYIAYLIRCRQGLLSTIAHLETLIERIKRDKLVCSKNLVSMCVRSFLEKKEKNMQLFVRKFQALTVSDEKAQLVEKFLLYLFGALEADPIWQVASEAQLDHARKVIERTVMSQIYIHALYPNGDGDLLRDQILNQHMQKLAKIITPNHKDLRIPKIYHSECPWPSAQAEIYTINAYKTPRDKIQCVLRCCSTIMNLLSMASEKSVPAADDFMPVLVYVIIKGNPQNLLSTVQYVNTFYESQLQGEESYWWTQFCSAIEFIKTIDY